MISRQLVAYNSATASPNKMHDDTVAKTYGFAGGLVPGVSVHAYLTWGPAQTWGLDWLERGAITARYRLPTYDGDTVTVDFDEQTGECRVLDQSGELVASATASLPAEAPPAPDLARYPVVQVPANPLPASPESLPEGRAMGEFTTEFPDDLAADYLENVREVVPIYAEKQIAHPGWVLRLANRVLATNVVLGPWIHASSTVQNYGLIHHGARLSCRGVVSKQYERSGHKFVELDLVLTADDELVATITHTAIYEPRPKTAKA
ncbi:hypothetical protein [Blastococcus sp. SYSU DS1024]